MGGGGGVEVWLRRGCGGVGGLTFFVLGVIPGKPRLYTLCSGPGVSSDGRMG